MTTDEIVALAEAISCEPKATEDELETLARWVLAAAPVVEAAKPFAKWIESKGTHIICMSDSDALVDAVAALEKSDE